VEVKTLCLKQKIILDYESSQYGNPAEIQFPDKLPVIMHRSGFFTRRTTQPWGALFRFSASSGSAFISWLEEVPQFCTFLIPERSSLCAGNADIQMFQLYRQSWQLVVKHYRVHLNQSLAPWDKYSGHFRLLAKLMIRRCSNHNFLDIVTCMGD
jgi:hypothetical protein